MPFSLLEKGGIKAHQPQFNPGKPFEAIDSAYSSGSIECHKSVRILSCHYVGIRIYAKRLTQPNVVSSTKSDGLSIKVINFKNTRIEMICNS